MDDDQRERLAEEIRSVKSDLAKLMRHDEAFEQKLVDLLTRLDSAAWELDPVEPQFQWPKD